jgi:hypothetical protein
MNKYLYVVFSAVLTVAGSVGAPGLLADEWVAGPDAGGAKTPPDAARPALPDIVIAGGLDEVMTGGGTGLAARVVTYRGRQLVMNPDWALGAGPGGACRIQVIYRVTNAGNAPTGKPFTVRILNKGKVVTKDRIEPLAAGEARQVITSALFSKGHHKMRIRLDAANDVRESDEKNNEAVFDYELTDRCVTPGKSKSDT